MPPVPEVEWRTPILVAATPFVEVAVQVRAYHDDVPRESSQEWECGHIKQVVAVKVSRFASKFAITASPLCGKIPSTGKAGSQRLTAKQPVGDCLDDHFKVSDSSTILMNSSCDSSIFAALTKALSTLI